MVTIEKDLQSFDVHDSEFRNPNINNSGAIKKLYADYDARDEFTTAGFKRAIEETKDLPPTHIDVGSGCGWLLRKTSPLFKQVIGIEPSTEGVRFASEILKPQFSNVHFINKDMVDGIKEFKQAHAASDIFPKKVFITTAIVLCHIEDGYVATFLRELADMENGSVIYFDERYGKNIQKNLWHIRSKEWWAAHLPDWQLRFLELNDSGYKSGIYATRVGKEAVTEAFVMGLPSRIAWNIYGALYSLAYTFKTMLGRKSS